MHSKAMRSGLLLDMLKTMAPRARLNGVPIMAALGVNPRSPCTIHGKRSGASANLGAAARAAAGWIELVTLPELQKALGGVIQAARRDRGRRRKPRRQSDRSTAGTMPRAGGWESFDPSDPSGLAADFLE